MHIDHSNCLTTSYKFNYCCLRQVFSILSVIVLLAVYIWAGVQEPSLYPSAFAILNSTVLAHFNILAVGDFECLPDTASTIKNIINIDPELILALGDYSYKDTADCWLKVVDPIDEKMKIVIGNHEVTSQSILNQYMSHFNLTKQYYSFNYHNVHFLVMSDYIRNEAGSEQYNFVNDDLKNAEEDPNIDWIIVNHHIQEYASTQKYLLQLPSEWIRIYHPLFEKYEVDLVLQGHQHNYQRTYPIKYNNIEPIYPLIAHNSSNYYLDPDGQIFATVGTGGATLHYPIGKAPYIQTQYVGFGTLNIDIINDVQEKEEEHAQKRTIKLIGTFYANDGTIKDEFTIEK